MRFTGRDATKAAAWIAAGAIGATVLTGIAFAATDDATPTPSTTPGATESAPGGRSPDARADGPRGMRGGPMGGPMGGPGRDRGEKLGDVLHGDVTVKQEDGTVAQARIQRGTLKAIDGSTLTVESEDGYTSTWTVDDDTEIRRERGEAAVTDLVVGDVVTVRGPISGDGATARIVRALSAETAADLETERAEREQLRKDFQEWRQQQDQGSNSSSSASLTSPGI